MSDRTPDDNVNSISLLNMQRIRQLRDADENERLDNELFAVFRTDGAQELELLEHACADRDAERLARHAHRLRGMSANLGMHALQQQLGVVEAEAGNPRLDLDFDSIHTDLRLLFQRTVEAFEAYIVESS